VLSGLQPPTKGTLYYKQETVYDKPANALAYFRAHQLGIVYQTNYWVKSLSVIENVSLPLYFSGLTKLEAHERAKIALRRVGMQEYINKHPTVLSGGEQQRVAMARALVNDPPVIIADEPTGNLDSKNGDMIIDLLTDLHKNEGKTIILVTHNMEYLSIADHLLEVEDGNVTEITQKQIPSTVEEILHATQNRMHKLMGKTKS
jgi:putative ABC transport system ATP-binding protein